MNYPYICLAAGIWLFAIVGCQHATSNPIRTPPFSDSSTQVRVLCRADRLLYETGTPVRLRALVSSQDDSPMMLTPTYDWSVEVGEVSSEGRTARWSLPEMNWLPAQRRQYTATVTVRTNQNQWDRCTTEVMVYSPTSGESPPNRPLRARGRLNSRALLVGHDTLPSDYGLYSFIVFTQTPKDAKERGAMRGLLDAWHRQLFPVKAFTADRHLSSLNVTYVPITNPPPENMSMESDTDRDAILNWIIEHYNFPRAHELLVSAGHSQTGGPYLLSFGSPPNIIGQPVVPRLLQDLEGLTEDLGQSWMTWFIDQTAREDFSHVNSREIFFRKLKLMLTKDTDVLKVTGVFAKIGAWFFEPINPVENSLSQGH